jgi:hypothetical protein
LAPPSLRDLGKRHSHSNFSLSNAKLVNYNLRKVGSQKPAGGICTSSVSIVKFMIPLFGPYQRIPDQGSNSVLFSKFMTNLTVGKKLGEFPVAAAFRKYRAFGRTLFARRKSWVESRTCVYPVADAPSRKFSLLRQPISGKCMYAPPEPFLCRSARISARRNLPIVLSSAIIRGLHAPSVPSRDHPPTLNYLKKRFAARPQK